MSVAEDVKGAFQGTRGKVLIGAGVVGVLYVWWTRGRTSAAPQPVPGLDDTSAGAHTSASAPTGSSGPSSSTDAGPSSSGRPTSNAEWQSRAVQILGNAPYNYSETAVWNAIAKAFQGDPLTAAEENWIRDAMRALGSPPEGMPPLNIAAPPSGGGGGTGGKLPAPTGFRDTGPIWRTDLELHWNPVPGAASYRLRDAYGGAWSVNVGNTSGVMRGGLIHNGTYFMQVAAVDASGNVGEWSPIITSHTKN